MQSQQQASIASGASDIASQAPNHSTPGAQQHESRLSYPMWGMSDKPLSHIEHAQAEMTLAFIRWHLTGDFSDAADYDKARRAWEAVVMGSVN